MHIKPLPVAKSSNVLSAGYDPEFQVLMVEFKNNSVYLYANVPPDIWEKMQLAESAGKFVSQVLKPNFTAYLRIR